MKVLSRWTTIAINRSPKKVKSENNVTTTFLPLDKLTTLIIVYKLQQVFDSREMPYQHLIFKTRSKKN